MKTLLTSAAAAVMLTSLASASSIVVSVDRGGSGDQANFSANSGQTFTTGSLGSNNLLSTIAFTGPTTGSDGPFTVKIWQDIDQVATTWDPGTELAASTNLINILTADGVSTATFDQTFAFQDNTVYVVSFTTDNGGGSQVDHDAFRMGLSTATNPLGSDGKVFNNGGDPAFGDNREIAFTVTAVPEPSSTALLGLGSIALLMRRRK